MKKLYFAVIALLLLTAAKATVGQEFNANNLAQLEVGKTTLAEAVALLGAEPQSSTVGKSGATAYLWQHVQSKSSVWTGRSDTQLKHVMLVFNTDGTFQRILQLRGVDLDPDARKRLMEQPAALHAAN
ncbi:hypothetical protein [Stenotrophomonas sp. AR029]|uniref:hypothetical protein n=1 Tax=Stenotrophomonas sp. AR029 TaxID=3398601 RepID=UPI0039C6F6C1